MVPKITQLNRIILALVFSTLSFQVVQAQEEDHSAQREAFKAAFDSCLSELGIEKPEKGQRPQAPDDSTRTQIDACLKEKGFEPPAHRKGGPPGGSHREAASTSDGVR